MPFLRQFLHQLDETLAFLVAEQVRRRHADFVEEQFRRIGRMLADLVEVAPAAEAAFALDRVCLYTDDRDALGALGRVGLGADEDEVGGLAVRDEGLRAIDDIFVAVTLRRRLDVLQVRARARLGHRDRGDDLARADLRQPAALLFLGAIGGDVRRDDRVVQRDAEAVDALPLLLLDDDGLVAEIPARAAILFRHRGAEQAHLAGLLPDVARHDTGLAPGRHMRRAFLFEELADGIGENVEFLILPPGRFRDVQGAFQHQAISRPGAACGLPLTFTSACSRCGPVSPSVPQRQECIRTALR